MKVEVAKVLFEPIEITIALESIEEVRALRRFTGGLPHSEISRAITGSNIPGPETDIDIVRRMSTQLYNITRNLHDNRKREV